MNLRAYAKINIGLRILGKRADGFHNIETIFHQINLFDELQIERADEIVLTTSSSHLPSDSRNLCVRAAEALRGQIRGNDGVSIRLTKRIPIGAGLGGGSSDAGTLLVALNKLWNAGLQEKELESLAATLGSDVAFFIRGGTAIGTSRGELLDFFELKIPFWIVTVTPPIQVSTAWAYANVQIQETSPVESVQTRIERAMKEPTRISSSIGNDFEDSVFASFPEIRRIKEKMITAGALFAQMSGSGSSVFGFFHDEETAQKALNTFASSSTTSITSPQFRPNPLD